MSASRHPVLGERHGRDATGSTRRRRGGRSRRRPPGSTSPRRARSPPRTCARAAIVTYIGRRVRRPPAERAHVVVRRGDRDRHDAGVLRHRDGVRSRSTAGCPATQCSRVCGCGERGEVAAADLLDGLQRGVPRRLRLHPDDDVEARSAAPPSVRGARRTTGVSCLRARRPAGTRTMRSPPRRRRTRPSPTSTIHLPAPDPEPAIRVLCVYDRRRRGDLHRGVQHRRREELLVGRRRGRRRGARRRSRPARAGPSATCRTSGRSATAAGRRCRRRDTRSS